MPAEVRIAGGVEDRLSDRRALYLIFFAPIVKWITFARAFPGQPVVHRMA